MTAQQYSKRNVMITFAIGFVAGTTPFVFMKLLPMMLHPELYAMESGQMGIMLAGVLFTGCLIGVISALIFAGEFEQKDPKEIFVYALGIPAILISTMSGLMTDFNAMQKISSVQASASAAILSAIPSAQSIPDVKTSPADQPPSTNQNHSFLLGTAWAEDRSQSHLAAAEAQYIVVIGTYTSEQDARDAFNRLQQRKFKAEAYVQKKLEFRKLDGKPAQFIVIYRSFDDQVSAQRASDLLKINDPDLTVSLMKAVQQ